MAEGVVAGADVVKGATTAGPKAGKLVADQTDQAGSDAEQSGSNPPPSTPKQPSQPNQPPLHRPPNPKPPTPNGKE